YEALLAHFGSKAAMYKHLFFGTVGGCIGEVSAVALLLGIGWLPETRNFETAPPLRRGWIDFSAVRWALASRAIGPVVATFFLATLGFGAFEVTLSLLVKDSLGFELRQTLLIFAYVGCVLVFTQGFLYRRLARRIDETTFIGWGIALMGGGIAVLGAMTHGANIRHAEGAFALPLLPLFFLGATLAVVGFAFLTPSTNALISRRTEADRQGEVLGVTQSAASMARILGPILGVAAYKMTVDHLVPYVCGAVILLLMLPLLPWIRRGGDWSHAAP
ncbi:MAG: MFS transporter, partial [Gemmataceae bacterium]|nr:MFS transporter [Gemmataceae bacterium]